LYFVTFTFSELEDGGAAGDWDGLYRFDLEKHRCDQLAWPGSLHASDGDGQTWLAGLLTVSKDGDGLICRAAMPASESSFGYWVAHLKLADLKLTTITKLEAVFA
jgi:hypothetical protein